MTDTDWQRKAQVLAEVRRKRDVLEALHRTILQQNLANPDKIDLDDEALREAFEEVLEDDDPTDPVAEMTADDLDDLVSDILEEDENK